jgi:hypothetical protein
MVPVSQRQNASVPEAGDDAVSYCRRLEANGHEEMAIRSALRQHFGMAITELGSFFEQFPSARLRHVVLLKAMQPGRSRYFLTRKLAKNLGISDERAEYWIDLSGSFPP